MAFFAEEGKGGGGVKGVGRESRNWALLILSDSSSWPILSESKIVVCHLGAEIHVIVSMAMFIVGIHLIFGTTVLCYYF